MPIKKLQMKAGTPITLMQFILALITFLIIQGGAYIAKAKSEAAEHQEIIDRIKVLEKYREEGLVRLSARQIADKERDSKLIQQGQDIELLKVTKKDK